MAFARDISGRRAAETLRHRYDRLNAIFDTEAAFVVALGADGHVVRANTIATELLQGAFPGYESADFRDLFPASRPAVPGSEAGAAGERLCAETFDTEVPLPGERTRSITWKSSPTHLSGEFIEVLVGIDVSAKRHAEMAMYQASKLVTLGEMATGLAHELNQPLAVIRLAVENIRASLIGMEKSPEYFTGKIQRIEEQVLRSREIIDNMRIFGRTPKDAPEAFDAGAATSAALSLTRKQIEGWGIRLDYVPSSEACTILGRPTLLQQVLVNLVLNARDAILERRQGGQQADPAGDFIRVAIVPQGADAGPAVCIEVSDTGGGIPPAVLPRIFEPFFTTKPVGKGTGLGLSVSFGIATEMNGRITASNRDRGAVFIISLPRAG